MKSSAAIPVLMVASLFAASVEPYRLALPGYRYEFPRDHFNHPDFQTEWWYYTGSLSTAQGERFGFELTFFRQGVDRDPRDTGVWDVRDVWMAHLALSDIRGQRFFHTERLNRSGAGIAGADLKSGRIWNGNWQARWTLDPSARSGFASQDLEAVADRFSFKLSMRSEKDPVIHGANGVSQKAEGPGRASHYISLTRLQTSGVIVIDQNRFQVEGASWMDHEFFTHQLTPDQIGWDWFSLQFGDGSEVMLFQIRRKDGSIDPFSAGTYVDPGGHVKHLARGDFSLTPGQIWASPKTGARYPIEWSIRIPPLGLDAALSTRLRSQELTGKSRLSPAYWEGAIDVTGTKGSEAIKGLGYLEMTGYTGKPPLSD
ncbi:MAG: lipocalin-like domain-containing protein [Bryobacteraceae bacterium]